LSSSTTPPRSVTPTELDTIARWTDVSEGFQLTNRKVHAAVTKAFNLDPGECDILLLLGRTENNALPMSALAKEIGFTSGGVTKVADRLARRELVERVTSPEDRRVVYLALTESGLELYNELCCLMADIVRSLWTDVLGEDRAAMLADSMAQLRDTHRDDR
jgi:DNA-binding MarR family transcriptional regulator